MRSRIAGVLGDAMKVTIAAWSAIWIEPWVEQAFPAFGTPLHYFIAAAIAAVILECILQIVLGWPRIKITWSVKNEDVEIAEIVARMGKRNPSSQVFNLKISTPNGGWLGYQLLRAYMHLGLELHIRVDRALLVPTREDGVSKTDGLPTVLPHDASNGFVVDLGSAPRKPGPWHWADIRWRNEGTPTGDDFNIYYVFHHRNAAVKRLMNCLIWRSKNARKFRVVGP